MTLIWPTVAWNADVAGATKGCALVDTSVRAAGGAVSESDASGALLLQAASVVATSEVAGINVLGGSF